MSEDSKVLLTSPDLETERATLRQLQDIICEKFDQAYHKQTSKVSTPDMIRIAREHTAIDLALCAYHLSMQARVVLFDCLPDKESKIQFLLHTDKETKDSVLRFMKDLEIKNIIEKLSIEDALKIVENLSERRSRRLLELLTPKMAIKIRDLQRQDKNSASWLMTSAFFAFPPDMTIAEAAAYIRDNPRIDFSKGVFIVEPDGQLLGHVPGRNLLINDSSLTLKQIMRSISHKVTPEATREEVVDIVERYKVPLLPVVDSLNRIVGVIAYEHVVDAMDDLADETMAKIAGTAENVTATEPVYKKVFARAPWLFVTLIAGLINSGIISFFKRTEGNFLIFALFFVPLITGMSGNIGIQCSTILVRGMAIGSLSSRKRKELFRKEMFIGLLAGAFFGILVGFVVFFMDFFMQGTIASSPAFLGIIVGTGLLGACLTGTLLGVFSPVFFDKIGIDPAIASGPIVTAFNDVLSMTIYFFIAWGLGHAFF